MDQDVSSLPMRGRFATGLRLTVIGCAAFALAGCASVSIPFGDSLGIGQEPLHTASSTTVPTEEEIAAAENTPLPTEISAVAPVAEPSTGEAADRPAEALIAAMPDLRADEVRLTQGDLNAMSRTLTQTLNTDPDVGTFDWAHAATGRSGVMTPFRSMSASGDGRCRVVSVEITDSGRNTILLADACQEGEDWVFVTPRAGQVL